MFATPSNWVRAESLQPLSIEAVALVAGLVLAWRFRHHGLVTMFALSLPFNDIVYRLGPITVSDILAIAILARRQPSKPWLIAPLFLWMCWGFVSLALTVRSPATLDPSLFSLSYGIRFALILLVMGTINLSEREARLCVVALRGVTILAAVVSVVQVLFYISGLPVAGVFAAGGFVRPKGLSHEPSTSAAWFAMAIPLLSVTRSRLGRIDRWLLTSIVIGIILTLSVSALVIVGVQLLYFTVRALRSPRFRVIVGRLSLAAVPLVIGAILFFGGQAGLLFGKAGNFVDEFSTGPRPTSLAEDSGRAGDLFLLSVEPPEVLFGGGLFVATPLAETIQTELGTYIPAANILITTAIETGVVGLAILMIALGYVLVGSYRSLRISAPDFVAGFGGFLAVTLGQRLLAFPQPWFMLAVARGLASGSTGGDPNHASSSGGGGAPEVTEPVEQLDNSHRHEANAGEDNVKNDESRQIDALAAVRRFRVSTAAIMIVGLILVAGAGVRVAGNDTVSVDIGQTGHRELAAALQLPINDAFSFNPSAEAFYINHAYSNITASVAGEYLVAKVTAGSTDEGFARLDEFSIEYLADRNSEWLAGLEAGQRIAEDGVVTLEEDLASIDQQLAGEGLTESTRTELVLTKTRFLSQLAGGESAIAAYQALLDSPGPIGVVAEPRSVPASTFRGLLILLAAVFVVIAVAVGQAVWRSLGDRVSSSSQPSP